MIKKRVISITLFVLIFSGIFYLKYLVEEKATETKTQTDVMGLLVAMKIRWNIAADYASSYKGVCADGLINPSFSKEDFLPNIEKILGVRDQIEAGIKCVSTEKSYAVSIAPNSSKVSRGYSLCLDSRGALGEGQIINGACQLVLMDGGYAYPPVIPTYQE